MPVIRNPKVHVAGLAVAIVLVLLALQFPAGAGSAQPKTPVAAAMYFSPT